MARGKKNDIAFDDQMTLMDLAPSQMESINDGCLKIVKAEFVAEEKTGWNELFENYDEMYGITFSSGISFMEKVFEKFSHVEMIFGFEGVLDDDIAAVISTQIKNVETLAKSKHAVRFAERMQLGEIELRVSRDIKSHEKIFILKAQDGRVRVIVGSANMSASAFCGLQRENIVCFDDIKAFDYYRNLFEDFKERCSDSVSDKVITALVDDEDYIRNNIDETPLFKTIADKKMVFLEQAEDDANVEYVADVKGMEAEIKPMIPKMKPDAGKILLTGETTKAIKRKYEDNANIKKVHEKKLPKLRIDYDTKELYFNGKKLDSNQDTEKVKNDVLCLTNIIDSLSSFHGDYAKSQKDYYKFLNWYFASIFMPYLRYVGVKNDYAVTPFPVMGILYGDSNGGKSTFVSLLSKLMSGVKIPQNNSNDFTETNISKLKRACEGIPINIDDLAKTQYDSNFEKVIKDDNWGIEDRFINYPSVVISTNKLASLKPDISKRVVTCRIDIKIDKDTGAQNAKKINESIRKASNAFYCEYVKRMLPVIDKMVAQMQEGEEEYFPDIFAESSRILQEIITQIVGETPSYVGTFSYSDYFGDVAIGQHAIEQIKTAWHTEPKMFRADKKKNQLIYSYPEGGRLYELNYLKDELPPALECQVTAKNLVMKLDVAQKIFGESFKKKLLQ